MQRKNLMYEIHDSNSDHKLVIKHSHNLTFPPHLHYEVELVIVLSGTITVTINDQTKQLKNGDLAVIFPNDIHSYISTEPSECLITIFKHDIISELFYGKIGKTLKYPFFENNTYNPQIFSLIKKLYEEKQNQGNEYVMKGILYLIFGYLNPYFTFNTSRYLYNTAIQNLLKYLASHYTEPLTLDSVAYELGFSKYYLSKLFNQKIGYSFNEHLNQLRINRFQTLLTDSDDSIANIALECGFESIRNFNRVFKKYHNITPSEYRILLKNK